MSPAHKAEVPTVGNVTSSGSTGGVTAGMIGSLQQTNVLPTLVRGPLLASFKEHYTTGASLYRRLRLADQTDDQIEQNCQELDSWFAATFGWLSSDVSPWAAERFAFSIPGIVNWGIGGGHTPEVTAKRSAYINAIGPLLQNLDQLMREPSIYPDTMTPPTQAPR